MLHFLILLNKKVDDYIKRQGLRLIASHLEEVGPCSRITRLYENLPYSSKTLINVINYYPDKTWNDYKIVVFGDKELVKQLHVQLESLLTATIKHRKINKPMRRKHSISKVS